MKRLLIALMLLLAASTTVNAADPFSSWTVPHKGVLETAQFWSHHQQQCGKPKGAAKWVGSTVSQRFARCQIRATFRLVVSPTPRTPQPTATASPQPTSPAPSPTPLPATATSTPTPQTPADFVLRLLNQDRAAFGVAPLTLDPTLSQCALAHSEHMYTVGYISHDQFPSPDLCIPYSTAGENVGMSGQRDVEADLSWLDSSMMAETPPNDGHRKNILSPAFNRIGIGVYVAPNGTTWLTEDFTN